MARYLVLIFGDEDVWANADEEWQANNEAGHRAFHAAAGAAVVSGCEVAPSRDAVSIRGDSDGGVTTTVGPFVQSSTNIGGFYVIEAADLAGATAIARQLPEASAPCSGIEIRAILPG